MKLINVAGINPLTAPNGQAVHCKEDHGTKGYASFDEKGKWR